MNTVMKACGSKLRMRWLRWLIPSIIVAVLLVVLWCVCKTVYLVNSTERDYLSTLFVLKLVEDYVTEFLGILRIVA